MSQTDFRERISRLESAKSSPVEEQEMERPTKPLSLLSMIVKFVLVWLALFLIFGFVYFLGTLGINARPIRWVLEMGIFGIAVFALIGAILCVSVAYLESRGLIDSRKKR